MMAARQLMGYLPDDFQGYFEQLLFPDTESYEWKLVKAADRISAYVKCLEELGSGNVEFVKAAQSIKADIESLDMPEAHDFMNTFAPSFSLPLDSLN
jgi:5'-deoxynucleotidase